MSNGRKNRAYDPYAGREEDRPEAREAAPPLLSRREFIRNTVRLAVVGALVPGTLAQVLPSIAPAALGGVGPGPVIRRDPQTNARIPISLADLAGDPPVVVTAEWNFLPAVVYKVRRSILESSSEKRGYNTAQFALQHPTEPQNAILVYDGKCKHLGCTVGWNGELGGSADIPDYNEDGFNDGRILCPCHQGQYDIYDLALNVPGTPPPAPLNVIEFDVKAWNDPTTGESFGDVVHGEQKFFQNTAREASGASTVVPAGAFELRNPGWSG